MRQPLLVNARSRMVHLPVTDLLMLLVVLIWGTNFTVTKLAIAQFPPLVFTALRFIIASTALCLLLRLREGKGLWPTKHRWTLVGLGIVGNTAYQVLFILGLTMTTAANSALFVAATPALVALLGAMLGVEQIRRSAAWGVVIALLGVGLVMATRGILLSWETLGGDVLVLISAICWAIYTLGVRALGTAISPLRITTITTLAGLPGMVLLAIPSVLNIQWKAVGFGSWGGLVYSAGLSLVLSYIIWNTSVQRVGTTRTSIYSCAIPIVASLVAWLVLGEQPKPLQFVGAILIIAGVLQTTRSGAAPSEKVAL